MPRRRIRRLDGFPQFSSLSSSLPPYLRGSTTQTNQAIHTWPALWDKQSRVPPRPRSPSACSKRSGGGISEGRKWRQEGGICGEKGDKALRTARACGHAGRVRTGTPRPCNTTSLQHFFPFPSSILSTYPSLSPVLPPPCFTPPPSTPSALYLEAFLGDGFLDLGQGR